MHPPLQYPVFTELEQMISSNFTAIMDWITEQYNHTPPMFYCSVDVRYSSFKVAPVDTNLFPSGFNNLKPPSIVAATQAAAKYLRTYYPESKKLLLIPENFTRNAHYWRNFCALYNIIQTAGYEVRCGVLEDSVQTSAELPCQLDLHTVRKLDNVLHTEDDWHPDLIILNNDLTTGIPEALQELAQPVIPHPQLGWHKRSKYQHCLKYQKVAQACAQQFGFDPWLITCDFSHCRKVNFKQPQSLHPLAEQVDAMISRITEQYRQHQINTRPHVYIKADSGTFGMGIMVAYSGEEVLHINKHRRHSMYVIKQGVINSSVILQEGVPTSLSAGSAPLEYVPYFIGGQLVGTLSRTNINRDAFSNLNSRGGMVGESLQPLSPIQRLVAELSALAAAHESMEHSWPK